MAPTTTLHALVTGFEPFGEPRPDDNRSWEAVRLLAGETIAAGDVGVVCHCHRLPVSYGAVSEAMPRLHRSGDFGIAIHCGEGSSGAVRLERLAHRAGYVRPGDQGPLDLPPGGRVPGYDSAADELVTDVDVDSLRRALAAKCWAAVQVSMDAGRYVCDYTYFLSLAEGALYPRRGRVAPAVLFVHVPPQAGDPYSESQLAEIVREIIRVLARTQTQRQQRWCLTGE
ncbi:Pyroglutamyl-peptidase 1 [Coemansia biformis]|uniref:Pyroglutamyl-peptidase 1 n=1 Tax=Coemansia biformis TaxID=1286918 RepID=A0A9W7YGC1_9FUNG|nr:Pyroglutamyl-peptidase 1 [Coemansia biformis]